MTQSGFINYEFPLSEGGKVVNRIIREECKSFVESTRVKRGALSHLASTVRKGFKILGKHKRKLRINPKPGREAGHLNRKGAVKNKYWRGPKPKPGTLLGAAMITGKLVRKADPLQHTHSLSYRRNMLTYRNKWSIRPEKLWKLRLRLSRMRFTGNISYELTSEKS